MLKEKIRYIFITFLIFTFFYQLAESSTLNGSCRITGWMIGNPLVPCEYTYTFTSNELSYSECKSYLAEVDSEFCLSNAPRYNGCIEQQGYVLSAYCTGGGSLSSFSGEIESWFKGSWLDTGSFERGSSFFSRHWSDDFHSWAEEARERWRSYLYRNAIAKETGIAVWQDNPFYEYLEWFYRTLKSLNSRNDYAVSVFPKLQDEPQSEAAVKYELDYSLLPLSSERESLFEIGSLFEPPELSGDNEQELFCKAEPPASIAPYFGIKFSSLYGKYIETSDIKLSRQGEKFIFYDGKGNRTEFKPYIRFTGLKDAYFMSPPGSKYQLKYESKCKDIDTKTNSNTKTASQNSTSDKKICGRFILETADNYRIELSTYKNDSWYITKMTASDGSWLKYGYDERGLSYIEDKHERRYKFNRDEKGKLISLEDTKGEKTYFQYNESGELISVKTASKEIKYSYEGSRLKAIERDGVKEVFDYDSTGRLISSGYEDGTNRISKFYNDSSSSVVITDALGAKTEYEYEIIKGKKQYKKIKDALGNTWRIERNKNGIETIINPAGAITEIIRNEEGNPIYIKDALGNGTTIEYLKRYEYQERGEQKTAYSDLIASITDPLGEKTQYKYDKNNNLTEIKSSFGSLKYKYDSQNHLKAFIDAEGRKWRYNWSYNKNHLPELLTLTDPSGNKTIYRYDKNGNIKSAKDARGNETKFEYDDTGNILAIKTEYDARIEFGYGGESCPQCSNGKLTSIKDALGNIWRYNYDKYGRLESEITPLNIKKQYQYDKMSKLTKLEIIGNGKKGLELEYEYDLTGRLKKVKAGKQLTEYNYDAVGNITEIKNPDSAIKYKYDANNRILEEKSENYTVSYSYDAVGEKTASENPYYRLTYHRNAAKQITKIINEKLDLEIRYTYDRSGLIKEKEILKSGKQINRTEYKYDKAAKLTSIMQYAGGKKLSEIKYEYDANGNITKKKDKVTTSYFYDKLNRLISAKSSDGAKEGFSYDLNGNRKNDRNIRKYIYDSANRLLENSKYLYNYDILGNLIKKKEKATGMETIYSYDAYNRLTQVQNTSTTVKFIYDALGRRTEKIVEDSAGKEEIFHYIYDGNNLIAMADKNNKLIAHWTYGINIDEPLVMTKYDRTGNAVNYFYHSDHLGSITYITNENGEVVESYDYKAYGEPTIKNAKGEIIPASVIGNLFMFTGREYEPELGLYFYRARYYDPAIGRFIQEDPISFSGGDLNLYVYVRNNPVNQIDPLGLWYIDINISIGWGMGITGGIIIDPIGIYTYKGAGAISPYGGISITGSKENVLEGLNFGVQPTFPIGPVSITIQKGATLTKKLPEFSEFGISWPPLPGISMTTYDIELKWKWPWIKENQEKIELIKYPFNPWEYRCLQK